MVENSEFELSPREEDISEMEEVTAQQEMDKYLLEIEELLCRPNDVY